MTPDISKNIKTVWQEIEKAASHHGVSVPPPKLIAVSKYQSDERITAALTAGHRVFGENRVQEAEEHWSCRREEYPDLELHLIGPLQSNKVARAVALFDVIETLDRPKLARRLKKEMDAQGRFPSLFIQVNTGEEPQKAGCLPNDLADLIHLVRDELNLPLEGLMCIPPVNEDAALHFALLKTLAEKYDIDGLSMGMSNDYAIAALMGATHIRVGTAVFGGRP